MTDRPGVIEVESVEQHEDGSATYNLYMDSYTQQKLVEEAIKFLLHCAACEIDIASVYDWMLSQMPPEDDIRPMTDEERQRAAERAKANGHE